MTDLTRFKHHCGLLRRVTTVVWAGLLVLLALPFLFVPLVSLSLRGDLTGHGWRDLLLAGVHVAPGLCYLWGLWAVRRALGELASGRLFAATVARALRQIGLAVVAGALLSLFAVTNLSRVILHGHGGFAYFDLSGIMLAIVGAALMLLARLVEQARQMQAELDEIL